MTDMTDKDPAREAAEKIVTYCTIAEREIVLEEHAQEKITDIIRRHFAEALEEIDIVFDGPPGPEPGRFVEVENRDGASIRAGEWIKREDGYWVLRLRAAIDAAREGGG